MLGWLIVLGVCVVLVIVGIIMCRYYYYPGEFVGIVGAVVGIFILIIVICVPIQQCKEIRAYEYQKQYIETHVPKNELEDVAITQSKIKLNQWLFEAKSSKLAFGIFSFYTDEIMGIEPIE